jgi:hypothetical protein
MLFSSIGYHEEDLRLTAIKRTRARSRYANSREAASELRTALQVTEPAPSALTTPHLASRVSAVAGMALIAVESSRTITQRRSTSRGPSTTGSPATSRPRTKRESDVDPAASCDRRRRVRRRAGRGALLGLLIAFNSLGLDYATDLVRSVVLFVPRLFVALLVLVLGAYFARFVGNALRGYCAAQGIGDADLLGRLAQYAVLLFVVLTALDQLDLGGALLQTTFLIAFAGVVLALAIAFGLGGRDWAAALLERWRPRRPPGP